MPTIKYFEDIAAWQKARQLVNLIYKLTKNGSFHRDFGLRNQIQRAAVSVMSNIAEGFERGNKEEFIYFLYIAKGSSAEVRSQLQIALDQNYIDRTEFQKANNLAVETSRLIYHFIQYLRGTPIRGMRFKQVPQRNTVREFLKKYAPDYKPPWEREKG